MGAKTRTESLQLSGHTVAPELRRRVRHLRILLFYGWDIRDIGGAETSVFQMAEMLKAAGHSVALADIRCAEFDGAAPEVPGIPYWAVPVVSGATRIRRSTAFLRAAWQVGSILHDFRPDVVSVQCPLLQCHALLAGSVLHPKYRLTVTTRGSDIRTLQDPYLKVWQARLLQRADAVIAVSQSLLQDVLALYPGVRGKARVIPNSIDDSWFFPTATPPPDRKRYVLFVGRLHAVKGVDLLLRSWPLLQAQLPGVDLWLAGDGDEYQNLRALTGRLGVGSSVRFMGYQTPAQLRRLYYEAEAMVLASRNEGLPRASLEAGACGAIRVATRAGGTPETIDDGATGILVAPESPESLAAGLLRALQLTEPERKRMKAAAREDIRRRFNQQKMVARYEEVFQSAS